MLHNGKASWVWGQAGILTTKLMILVDIPTLYLEKGSAWGLRITLIWEDWRFIVPVEIMSTIALRPEAVEK